MANKMTKLLSSLLAAALTVSALPLAAFASDTVYTDTGIAAAAYAEDFAWEISEDGVLTITGTGDMPDWGNNSNQAPWYSQRSSITSVEIGEGITSVGMYAFYECRKLKKVTLPESLERIRDGAFYKCNALSDVALPEKLTSIGTSAFYLCKALAAVVLPDNLTEIGNSAFCGTALKSVVLPENLTELGSAFSSCTALTDITLPEGLKVIGDHAFDYCTALKTVTLPENLETIGSYAFQDCTVLTSITIPDSVTSIGDCAFIDSGLTEITLPNTITHLPAGMFVDCENLVFYTVPEHITSIGAQAFVRSGLKTIVLHEGITSFGQNAFSGCASLESIEIPSGVTEIPAYCFKDCAALSSVTLPDRITSVGNEAFYGCRSLKEMILPESVTALGEKVFYGCWKLEKVVLPSGITEIPFMTLRECSALTDVTLSDQVTSIGLGAFYSCTALTEFKFPQSLESIGNSAFSWSGLKEVTLPEGLKTLGEGAFSSCKELTKVTLPENLTTIERDTFMSCTALTSVNIPLNLKTLKTRCFQLCSGLSSLVFLEDVETIQSGVFYGCTGLTIYAIPGSNIWNYAVNNNIPVLELEKGSLLTVSVQNSAGEEIGDGITVNWYETGSDICIASGKTFSAADTEISYDYEILLDESLSYLYYPPVRTTVESGNTDDRIVCTLDAIPDVRVTGSLADPDGNAVAGTEVLFRQTYNGLYGKDVKAEVTDGTFAAQIGAVPTRTYITADGYYDRMMVLPDLESDTYDLGTVTMNPLSSEKITLTLKTRYAALEDGIIFSSERNDTNNLEFKIMNLTTGQALTGITVQYPDILLEEAAVFAGDILEISVTDTSCETTAEDVRITLDEHCCAEAEILLIENGSVSVKNINGSPENYVMIFDCNGTFVKTETAGISYGSSALPAGTYTMVFLQKNGLLRTVPSIGKFMELNLTEGADYTAVSVEIVNGVITVIDAVDVPSLDESRLFYTVDADTHFTSNAANKGAGEYILFRAQYKIDEKYDTSNEKIIVDLPEEIVFTNASVTFNGKVHPYAYDEQTRTLIISAGSGEGIVRFYAIGTADGEYNISAYLGFDLDGETITQPIGTESFALDDLAMGLPSITHRKNFFVSGKTLPNSILTVYDNGVKVGETTANRTGSWAVPIELVKPYNISFHDIRVDVVNKALGVSFSGIETVLYNSSHADLASITMYNTGTVGGLDVGAPVTYITSLNFLTPQRTVPEYVYSADYPTFTFRVGFDGGEPENIKNVRVLTRDRDGDTHMIRCSYDEKSESWVGKAYFASASEVPVSLTAAYEMQKGTDGKEHMPVLDEEGFVDYAESFANIHESSESKIKDLLEYSDLRLSDDGVEMDILYDGEVFATYSMSMEDYSLVDDTNWDEINCVKWVNEETDEIMYSAYDANSREYVEHSIFPESNMYMKSKLTLTDNPDAQYFFASSSNFMGMSEEEYREFIIGWLASWNPITAGFDAAINVGEEMYLGRKLINTYYDLLMSKNDLIADMLDARCPDGSYKLHSVKRTLYINEWHQMRKKTNDFLNDSCNILLAFLAVSPCIDLASSKMGEKIVKLVDLNGEYAEMARLIYRNYQKKVEGKSGRGNYSKLARKLINKWSEVPENALGSLISVEAKKWIEQYVSFAIYLASEYEILNDELEDMIKRILADYSCSGGDPFGAKLEQRIVNPICDPSGYVYEAVPSNRVEGVKAEAYYYDYPVDEFGVPADEMEEIFWNAEEYDQVNPLYTDEDGTYAWDVPFGRWLVKFSKDGYHDTDSRKDPAVDEDGYLPVPPPQTEVNTAIVSKSAPEVDSVMVYNDSVRIEFSQYMQPDTVNADTVTVVCGGSEIPGTLEPVNLEYDYEEVHQYASVYTFVPETDLSSVAAVTIAGAVNYADREMAKAFTETQKVTYRPESIDVPETIEVAYNSCALLNIQILSAEAGANRTIAVSSVSTGIVSVLQDTVVTDENGCANVMVEGLLPGTGVIRLALEGTGLEAYVMAEVGDIVKDDSACEKVEADIASGSTVESGTLLTLTTGTEGADIYYTLDGSCPCVDNNPARILYTGPIEITEDMYLIAYAVKDGCTDSPTAGYAYKVRMMRGDVDGNGDVDENDRDILTYYFAGYAGYEEQIVNRKAADIDGDGELTRRDAMILTRRIAGWSEVDSYFKAD